MEILIGVLVACLAARYGISDLVWTVRGQPRPAAEATRRRHDRWDTASRARQDRRTQRLRLQQARVQLARDRLQARQSRRAGAPGPARAYGQALWGSAWHRLHDRHQRLSEQRRAGAPRGAAGAFWAGIGAGLADRWDAAWRRMDATRTRWGRDPEAGGGIPGGGPRPDPGGGPGPDPTGGPGPDAGPGPDPSGGPGPDTDTGPDLVDLGTYDATTPTPEPTPDPDPAPTEPDTPAALDSTPTGGGGDGHDDTRQEQQMTAADQGMQQAGVEITDLPAAIAWATQMGEATGALPGQIEQVQAGLRAGDVDGEPVDLCGQMAETAQVLSQQADQLATALQQHMHVREAYQAGGNEAGSKAFVTSGG